MANTKEVLEKGVAVYVKPPVCGEKDEEGNIVGECKGGEINLIREDGIVIVHCKGLVCSTSAEKIEIMKRDNKGGSTD